MPGTHSSGTYIAYGTAADTWTATLGLVTAIGSPQMKASDIDTTHLTSTDEVRTFMAGFTDTGNLSVDFQYEKVLVGALATIFYGRDTKYWKITLPDGSTSIGQGHINDYQPHDVPEDDLIGAKIGIKASGKWTFTAG